MPTIQFILANKKFLTFGLLLTLFSTFGQTSFLSIFTPYLQQNFDLTSGGIGLIYSLATLTSALAISQTGQWIDRVSLNKFTLYVLVLFIIACLCMAISSSLIVLALGYFLLRYTCQGLMSHTSMVSIARYFDEKRGRALSIAALGYPIGDACLPFAVSMILQLCSVKATWWLLSAFAIFAIFPLLLYLLKDHHIRHQNYLATTDKAKHVLGPTPIQILHDWKFYCITIGILAPGFINTGIFFQHSWLIQAKNWPQYVFAASLTNYAIGNVCGSFLSGWMIDRLKSVRIISFYLSPMLLALLLLLYAKSLWSIYLFMIGIGLSQGSSSVIVGAVWAELYGSKYLGTIRSWVSSLKVLCTAVSPALFGYFLDRGTSFGAILIFSAVYTFISIFLLTIASIASKPQAKVA